MPLVVFAAPWFSENALRYLEAIAGLPDVRLAVISHEPEDLLPPDLRMGLAAHWRMDDIFDGARLAQAAETLSRGLGPIHRLFAAQEQLQVPAAEARERLEIPGMSVAVARNFREKERMKSVLRVAGIPCARHRLVTAAHDAWEFADTTGFPLVVKPPAGAGAASTFPLEGPDALRAALVAIPPRADAPLLLEEFIAGEEHSLETYSVGGRHLWHSLTRYYPTALEVLRTPWMQWCLVLPREVDDSRYDEIRLVARRALDALGMETGLSHLEWFRRGDGSVAVSEVGARPPGAQITTLMSRAYDFDALTEWARVMVYGAFVAPVQQYAAGVAFLRGQGHGHVVAVHGVDETQRAVGHLVTDVKLPAAGQPASGTYEGEGYVIVRHPETAIVEQALMTIITTMRIELS